MSESNELESLKRRVERLEAIEAIRQLKAEYARYCDPVHNIDGMVNLFTKDAVFDIGEEYGSYHGQEEIRAFLKGADDIIPWAIHYMVSPQIELSDDAQSAHGTWYLWQLATSSCHGGSRQNCTTIVGIR